MRDGDAKPDDGGPGFGQPRERITAVAVCFAAGIALGWLWPEPRLVWPWLAGGLVSAAAAAACLLRRGPWRLGAAAGGACAVCFGALWLTVGYDRVPVRDLRAWVGSEPVLLRLRGVALEGADLRERTSGALARFAHRPQAAYFLVRVEETFTEDGGSAAARGKVLVRVDEPVAPFRAGDRVEVTGTLLPPGPPANPGEFDYRRAARSRGVAGLLAVPRRELLRVAPAPRGALVQALRRTRQSWRARSEALLLADLPRAGAPGRDALLLALLLGRRGPELAPLDDAVRRIGLAHFLAISGHHLSVLAAFVLAAARLMGHGRRWHGWLIVGVVLAYLVVVDLRMPVLRAGIMTAAASLGLAAGRRYQVSGLLAASGIALLLWRPAELLDPGFQLSYGVVMGLLHLSPVVRRRWFGPPDQLAASSAQMAGQWLRSGAAASFAAWAVSTPIAIFHWQLVWPLAPLLGLLALPPVAAVLLLGYAQIVLGALLPSAAKLLAIALAFASDVLISLVHALDRLPLCSIAVPAAPWPWALAALLWVAAALRVGVWGRSRAQRALWAGGAVLLAWLWAPALARAPVLRVDMLSVGDGSCYLVRSGRSAVLFDAGSSTSLDAGRRIVVPALRRLGVRELGAVIVSHANLDHYSAVPEIAEAIPVGTVLVTPQFVARAAHPEGPVVAMLDWLNRSGVPVRHVSAGAEMTFGRARFRWLHPLREAGYGRVNDESMVVRVEAAGRSVLLCGDIQAEAMSALLDGGSVLQSDVLELPHHGSHHAAAELFVAAVGPRVVLQSSGRTAWSRSRDRWAAPLEGAAWLASARDGACWVEVDRRGSLACGRFRAGPSPYDWGPLRPQE